MTFRKKMDDAPQSRAPAPHSPAPQSRAPAPHSPSPRSPAPRSRAAASDESLPRYRATATPTEEPPLRRGPLKRIAAGAREAKVCGMAACEALFAKRFEDVIRISILDEMVREFAPILKRCAAERKAYHIVSPEELLKISETSHSEGICVLAKAKPLIPFSAFLTSLAEAQPRVERLKQGKKAQAIVVLEGVRNPHNFGAILRVCAHFGADAVIYDPADSTGGISTAVYRTAEGGVESLKLVAEHDLPMAVKELKKKGIKAFATSGHGKVSVFKNGFSPRAMILLGSEAFGLSPALLSTADEVLQIPGTGGVESLNVACAASVALAEFWREHRQ